jgi:hypothetical protein
MSTAQIAITALFIFTAGFFAGAGFMFQWLSRKQNADHRDSKTHH